MHDRRVNGKTLSFGHAGILYRNSFVMYDRETESLWVHVTGRAEVGPREGWQLRFMPSTVTTASGTLARTRIRLTSVLGVVKRNDTTRSRPAMTVTVCSTGS